MRMIWKNFRETIHALFGVLFNAYMGSLVEIEDLKEEVQQEKKANKKLNVYIDCLKKNMSNADLTLAEKEYFDIFPGDMDKKE